MLTSRHSSKVENRGRKQNSLWQRILKYRQCYVILLPTLLFYAIFCYVPMGGVVIAFQKYSITKGILGSKWVGLYQFKLFLSNYKFWQLLRNTLLLNFYSLLVCFPAPIIFALLLNEVRNVRFKKVVQMGTYMPHFISVVVACSMVLTFVSRDGLVNMIIGFFGHESISFMSEPKYFRTIYIISNLWQNLGWSSIIYVSALSSIDQQLYEAAAIDGANRWKQMIHVTMPGILPTVTILLIMQIGKMLTVGYDKIILLYNPAIYETADVISTYVYRRGLLDGDFSYSTAVGLFNSTFNFIFLMTSNWISKKISGNGLW